MEIPDEYLKGFNSGYLLRKHQPMLSKELTNGMKGKSPYISGLKAGGKEYEKELDLKLERMKQSKKIGQRSKGKGLGI